jgi:diguanylate cyclase (GGDEF)-like protein
VTDHPPPPPAVKTPEGSADLLEHAREAHRLLMRLPRPPVGAEARLESHLVEANEQLVLAALRAHRDSEATTRALHEASRSAEHDALTELPNRVLLLDRLERAMVSARRHGTRFALMFMDIDRFKDINDTLGHAAGDQVLRHAAQCLVASIRGSDTVSRHGGDEFLILLSEMSQASDLALVAEKVIAALGAPAQVGEQVLRLTASIGISIYPDHGEDAVTLIERADAAMYRAKRRGPGRFAFYDEVPLDGTRSNQVLDLTDGSAPSGAPQSEPERRMAQLREANERLVIAAMRAQASQALAEEALLRRQTEQLGARKPEAAGS